MPDGLLLRKLLGYVKIMLLMLNSYDVPQTI